MTPEEQEAEDDRVNEEATKALPATFADAYYVYQNASLTRITLGENNVDEDRTFYRAAFIMRTEDAVELARSILRLYDGAAKE